jgi:hypothetical protein
MAVEAKSVIGSLREVVQDLLVPELKAVKVSIDSLRSETKVSLDSLRQEMRLRDEMTAQALRGLSEKLDYAIDIRERLASLEARMPRQ